MFFLYVLNATLLRATCKMVLQVHLDFLMPKALDGFLTKLTDVSTTNHTFSEVRYDKSMYRVCTTYKWITNNPWFSLSLSEFSLSIGKDVLCILTYILIRTYAWIKSVVMLEHKRVCVQVSWSLIFKSLVLTVIVHKSNWKNGFV